MARLKIGNIFDEEVEALVNSVNCVGVMGKGIALEFKKRFPGNFAGYQKVCKRGELVPGKLYVHATDLLTPRFIINFPTKRHWREKTRIEYIDDGLDALTAEVKKRGIKSIAIPALGSSLGGLRWDLVWPRIQAAVDGVEGLDAVIFEPGYIPPPPSEHVQSGTGIELTVSRAVMIVLIGRYRNAMLDPIATNLEIHKLAYFAQVAGIKLSLQFEKGPYGPYGVNVRHVLKRLEGRFIHGSREDGDNPWTEVALLGDVMQRSENLVQRSRDQTAGRLDKVFDLISGFESQLGLELLATVHWVATSMERPCIGDVVQETLSWNERKSRIFSQRQIEVAFVRLRDKGWIIPSR